MGQHKALQRPHDHRGQGDGYVVIQSCGPWLFEDRDDGGDFEAGWQMTCLQ